MRPLARVQGTPHQSTTQQSLMTRFNATAMTIVLITTLIVRVTTSHNNLLQEVFVSQTNQSRGSLPPASLAQ